MAIRVRVLGTRRVPDPWGRAWVPFFTRGLCPYPTRCEAGTGWGSNLTHGYPVGTRQKITKQNISVSLFQQFSPTFGPAQNYSSGRPSSNPNSSPIPQFLTQSHTPIPTRAAAPAPQSPLASPHPSARRLAALGPPQSRRRTPPSPPWCPPAGCTAVPAAATRPPPPPPPLGLLRRRSASSARHAATDSVGCARRATTR
jgi:hypothetical protein